MQQFTGNPICSVPCDSIDDNCATHADEEGCKNFGIALLLPPVVLTIFLGAALLICWKLATSKRLETAREPAPLPMAEIDKEKKEEHEQYREGSVREAPAI